MASPSELIDGSPDALLPNLPSAVRLPTKNDVGAEAAVPGVAGAVVTARTACGTGSPVMDASREANATSTQVPVGCSTAGQGVPIGPAGTTRRAGLLAPSKVGVRPQTCVLHDTRAVVPASTVRRKTPSPSAVDAPRLLASDSNA